MTVAKDGTPAPAPAGTGMHSVTRLTAAALLGIVVAVVLVVAGESRYAPAVGWDAAALTYLTWTWSRIWPMDPDTTSRHARREDPSRPISDVLLIVAAIASLAAVGFFLIEAGRAPHGAKQDLLAGVGVLTVALSWLVVHTVYTVQYAMLYYGGRDGGIDFNQTDPPRYSDFAYLALTIGMTFQVSDTNLQAAEIRATALRQALISYLFGAVILATMINLIASMASGA
jgi:uncharacterized membrane protein